ncbi:hypothetical protein NIES2119_31765 [[Phormidium ambiguum] IAM M-71]|uniref:DUF2281 domain-containing protein n=2 Tax=[Phormidium ambiguum] IAM M-71 TaxID=454136 RepID=A0A1U7I1N4_9CYAN|nr:hypothetical protein NIES2119_31765 [Phormidium ambiguum IAM M-71]
MSIEEAILVHIRVLPPEKQQEVLDFAEFLRLKTVNPKPLNLTLQSSLGERLRQIRGRIVASGTPLLNREELEKEVASRRGGIENKEE